MLGDLLYAAAFILLASIVLVPSLLATRTDLIANWSRQRARRQSGRSRRGVR